MKEIIFDKLRQNKVLAMDSETDQQGHFKELFTVILNDDDSLTFQFRSSVSLDLVAANSFDVVIKK